MMSLVKVSVIDLNCEMAMILSHHHPLLLISSSNYYHPYLYFFISRLLSGLHCFSKEQPFSKIYNSLRYDDTAGIVTFHLREQDWDQIKSHGLMWLSSLELVTVAGLSSLNFPLEVIECNRIFLRDERVENRGHVDPVQTFGLFSVQLFNIVEANNVNAHTLKVHVHHFFALRFPEKCRGWPHTRIRWRPNPFLYFNKTKSDICGYEYRFRFFHSISQVRFLKAFFFLFRF